MQNRIEKTMENLKANNMDAELVSNRNDALKRVEELIPEGATVAVGGSVTLTETGILNLLRCGKFNFLDRYKEGLTPEEIKEIYTRSMAADYYLCSSNAITEKGELYNVDGNCNRISALSFGPKNVIVVAGVNKIVADLEEAVKRVKLVAAPKNAKRLGINTYCDKNGRGVCAEKGGLDSPTAGCGSDSRICCSYLVCGKQRIKNRIKVILVEEELGY